MTKRECAIIEAYTGETMLVGRDREIFFKYAEEILRRSIPKSVYSNAELRDMLREASQSDFIRLCCESKSDDNVYFSDRLRRESVDYE